MFELNNLYIGSIAALSVLLFIFLLTLLCAAKRWISFSSTLLFLLFSLVAGITIADHDLIRSYITGVVHESYTSADLKNAHFQEQVLNTYESLKAEIRIQKHEIEILNDLLKTKDETLDNRIENFEI